MDYLQSAREPTNLPEGRSYTDLLPGRNGACSRAISNSSRRAFMCAFYGFEVRLEGRVPDRWARIMGVALVPRPQPM